MDEEQPRTKDSAREDYIVRRVGCMLGFKKTLDAFRKATFEAEENKRALTLFLDDNDDIGYLAAQTGKGSAAEFLTNMPGPTAVKKKLILVFKSQRGVPIDERIMKEQIGFMELTRNILENLSVLSQEVYLPVLSNPEN